MIDRASIMAWNEFVPWTDFAMVEQDLIISRALVDIFSDDFLRAQLAFRGGTALHKLYLSPQVRNSEDIFGRDKSWPNQAYLIPIGRGVELDAR